MNYTSFEEHAEEARVELQRLVDSGHLEEVGSWEDVVARWPDARPVRIAVSVTLKSDGTKKVDSSSRTYRVAPRSRCRD